MTPILVDGREALLDDGFTNKRGVVIGFSDSVGGPLVHVRFREAKGVPMRTAWMPRARVRPYEPMKYVRVLAALRGRADHWLRSSGAGAKLT
jgi:hypothetical protein